MEKGTKLLFDIFLSGIKSETTTLFLAITFSTQRFYHFGSDGDSSLMRRCHVTLISSGGGGAFVLYVYSLPGGITSFPSASWQIMAVLFSGSLKYITWIIHPPAEDWTGKQLPDKQFAKLKMHVSGGPCRCNTAYLADAPCFIDAARPSFACFRRHQPDEISAMLHFTTTRQPHWHARNYRHCWAFSSPYAPLLFATEPTESRLAESCSRR